MQAQHLPGLAAHLPSMPLAPHAAAAAAAAGLGASGAAAAGIMAMAAGRMPGTAHLHSAGSSSSGVKEEKGERAAAGSVLLN
jgi:hypothetical protein